MKRLLMLFSGVVLLSGCRSQCITTDMLWTRPQVIAAYDYDPVRQDVWCPKEIAPGVFLIITWDGRYVSTNQLTKGRQ